jgi:hypothetical protein
MLAQTSVYRTSAPRAACWGSWRTSTSPPSAWAAATISALGSCPGGQAIRNRSPRRAEASIREWATLFPSPMNASTVPRSSPRFSRIVSMSPRAWQGWWRSERPLITGTVAERASSSTTSCPNTRAMIPSTYRDRLRAMSSVVSRLPSLMSSGPRYSACPPSCVIPTSNETLVRRDGF